MEPAHSAGATYPVPDGFDETFAPDRSVRSPYRDLLEGLDREALVHKQRKVESAVREAGIVFGQAGDRSTFAVDALPRVITASQWSRLERGLRQRIRALQRFLGDVYGGQEIFSAGLMRRSILDDAPHFEPLAKELEAPVRADLAGPDLVHDGESFHVLEDNLRFPSGLAFAAAARQAVTRCWHAAPELLPGEPAFELLGQTLRARDPSGNGDPGIAILTSGHESTARFEHELLAGRLDARLVTRDQLELVRGRVLARTADGPHPVDVLYNRSNTDRLGGPGGKLTALGSLLLEPLRHGRLACVNSFGAGIADDKAVHCYTEELVRFYLDEEPLLQIPRSFDLGDPDQASEAMEQLDRLAIKPRWKLGGEGVTIGPETSAAELERVRQTVKSNPSGYIAQEMVSLSTHPTVTGDRIEPRHIDLRPYVMTCGDQPRVAALALTRFSRAAGDPVVSSTQGGGAKDTWILKS